jgi:hypothetical protein
MEKLSTGKRIISKSLPGKSREIDDPDSIPDFCRFMKAPE